MKTKTIYLAGGCFWGVERYFQRLGRGILETESGYANGTTKDPSYRDVCRGDTGYAETVRLVFDEAIFSVDDILAHFFRIIDPTTRDRQGNDIGDQYRPGVYFVDAEDFPVICDYIDRRRKDFKQAIVIEVLPLDNFYSAEDYHQDYLVKNPSGYCHVDLSLADIPLRPEELALEVKEDTRSGQALSSDAFESHLDAKTVCPASYERDEGNLKESLSDIQYKVTQEDATERPFMNEFDQEFSPGLYVDVVSGEPLFSSRDKYDAGCGWPAFSRPVARGALVYKDDTSLWRKRVEVRSVGANSHLGHVFDDGPSEEGGLRYCINSAALRFIPLEDMEKHGYADWLSEVISEAR